MLTDNFKPYYNLRFRDMQIKVYSTFFYITDIFFLYVSLDKKWTNLKFIKITLPFRLVNITATGHMSDPVILAAGTTQTQRDRCVIRFGWDHPHIS